MRRISKIDVGTSRGIQDVVFHRLPCRLPVAFSESVKDKAMLADGLAHTRRRRDRNGLALRLRDQIADGAVEIDEHDVSTSGRDDRVKLQVGFDIRQ